jgi:integrase
MVGPRRKGRRPSPRELSDACKTTIHAARSAVRRYKSGIIPKESTPGLAPKTVRNVHALIHRAFADAVGWKYMSSNPANNVKPPKLARTRREVWAPDQIQTFLTAVQNDRFAALFVLELTTGIRRGQVCGLKWTAADLDVGEVTVQDNRVVVAGHAKDKSSGKTKNAGVRTAHRFRGPIRTPPPIVRAHPATSCSRGIGSPGSFRSTGEVISLPPEDFVDFFGADERAPADLDDP